MNAPDSKFEPRIVGGEAVNIEAYPFAVQFLNMGRLCGGVIINSWSIVTAGHCLAFSTDMKQMIIQAGAKYTYDFNADRYRVRAFVIHEDYNKEQAFSCDIALVFVDTPIKLGPRAKKGILVNHKEWMNDKEENFIVTGWGYTKHKGEVSKVGLKMARLHYINPRECSKFLDGHNITADTFCLYGYGERDTCQGDSGGGVLWNNMLVGLTSYGEGCAVKGKPSIYANIWHLRSWIIKRVNDFVEQFCDSKFRFKETV
ncbi:unnamed protein product [Arctia plantaginis]|uniref:Peptidase S1 domain-containing protein n=1 Tax=Arctia plantaginis TaxID=874455 RepID=A0A8S1AU78_ARCPL|nr:unnamed protein product [Arctia plantaginis]